MKIRFFTKPVLFCQAASDLPNTLRSEKFWSRILTESLIQLLIVGVAWGLFFMLVDFLGEHLISVFSVTLFISSIGALVYPLYSIIRRGYTLSFDNSSIVVKNVFGIRTKLFRIDSTKILKNSLLPADHGLTEFDNYVFESRGRSICIICESEKDQRLISSFLSGEFNALAIYNASNTKEVKSNETKVSQISRKGKLSLFEDFSKYKLWFIIGLIVLLIGVLVDYRIATKSDIGLNLIAEMLGASGNFFIGRKLARKFMIKKFPKMKRYADQLNTKIVFLLALIPVGTSNITGYIAGISKMRFKRYLGTWMLGITLLNTSIALLGYSARIQSVKLTVIIIVIGLISMYGIYQIIKKWE